MAEIALQPSFHILVCLIKIWKIEDIKNAKDDPKRENTLLISEVENIEIEDTYKKLITKASVKFPRGTVVKKTITTENAVEISTGVDALIDDTGILITTTTNSELAKTSHFQVGNRVRIMLGYTTDPKVAALTKIDNNGKSIFNDSSKLTEYEKALTTMFDGYITKCSISTPIEIECENLASGLKKITCPKIAEGTNKTVNDLFAEDGKWKLLKDSGLDLHPDTKSCKIDIGKVGISEDLTVADVFTTWNKMRLYTFIKDYNGVPHIAVGRSYFSNIGKDSILRDDSSEIPQILFSYHVAKDGLTLMNTNKDFLAVEAQRMGSDGKFYKITIIKNLKYDSQDPNSKKYRLLNETKLSKKAQRLGAKVMGGAKHVDLSIYTVIPYMSKKIGGSNDELLEEAIKHFESYNMNGIDGSLTLFGDLKLKSGIKVELVDKRFPDKNGYYLVEEVTTTFSTDGFRQTIKLPYKIASKKSDK
jgi:hypothetical protein